jgi:hypothetical protein
VPGSRLASSDFAAAAEPKPARLNNAACFDTSDVAVTALTKDAGVVNVCTCAGVNPEDSPWATTRAVSGKAVKLSFGGFV